SHPWPALGERWPEVEFLLEGRSYTWGSTGQSFSTENMKFANALVIGRLNPAIESGTTVALRPHNWSFWDPAAGTPGFAVGAPLAITIADVADGVYTGTARAYNGPLTVQVTVVGGRIIGITVTNHVETEAFLTLAVNGVVPQILAAQDLRGIDAVAGATAVSEGIVNAVADALR
ncbi:MAG: FMN-binding protein, partial [Treponema sp.]|nr:FMN-binding protein [Treponema sp.]